MKSIKVLFAVSILALNAAACDDGTDAKETDASIYVAACKRLCQTLADQGCATVAPVDCQDTCNKSNTATGACAEKLKLVGDCYDAAVNVCVTDLCSTERTVMTTACTST